MTFERNIWKLWRKLPGSYQRFEGKVSDDNSIIEGYWEYSKDGGKTWKHEFDLKYSRK
jgi:hypothetical protein